MFPLDKIHPSIDPLANSIHRPTQPFPSQRGAQKVSAHLYVRMAIVSAAGDAVNALGDTDIGDNAKYQILCVEHAIMTQRGDLVSIKWRGFAYEDGSTFWEWRRCMSDFYTGTGINFVLHKTIKDVEPVISFILNAIGASMDDHFKPSLRAAPYRGEAAVRDPKVRSEYTLSTLAVCAWLVVWSVDRHSVDDREIAKCMLRAFVTKVLSLVENGWHVELLRHAIGRAPLDRCTQNRGCSHLDDVLLPPAAQVDSGLCIAHALHVLFENFRLCPASAGTFEMLVKLVARQVDAVADRFVVDDCTRAFPLLQGPKKKRRIDQEYKDQVAVRLVESRRAQTGSQALRLSGDACPTACSRWEKASLLEYQLSGVVAMKMNKVVFMIEDACRNGSPCEDVLCSLLWDSDANAAVVPPPQAKQLWYHRR